MNNRDSTRLVDRLPEDLVHAAVRAQLPKERKSLGVVVSQLAEAAAGRQVTTIVNRTKGSR